MPPRRPSTRSAKSHRSTLSLQKTEIIINVYDLLPPGRVSAFLWTIGTSLLHSGVIINGREYAYGGSDQVGQTGVYWTPPNTLPPGGTFRSEILHGFTLATPDEINTILKEASEEWQGTGYNLLTRNCNHFTQYLCEKLTGRAGPSWLNRAASIGVALPCVVPREWIEPPDQATAGGELLDDDEHADENSRMLRRPSEEQPRFVQSDSLRMTGTELEFASDEEWNSEEERRRGGSGKGKGRAGPVKDTSGRKLPAAETAPPSTR